MLLCRFYQPSKAQSRNKLYPAHTKEGCLKETVPIKKHKAAIPLPPCCSPRSSWGRCPATRHEVQLKKQFFWQQFFCSTRQLRQLPAKMAHVCPLLMKSFRGVFRAKTPLSEVIQLYEVPLQSFKYTTSLFFSTIITNYYPSYISSPCPSGGKEGPNVNQHNREMS